MLRPAASGPRDTERGDFHERRTWYGKQVELTICGEQGPWKCFRAEKEAPQYYWRAGGSPYRPDGYNNRRPRFFWVPHFPHRPHFLSRLGARSRLFLMATFIPLCCTRYILFAGLSCALFYPFRTPVPFPGQTTHNLSALSPHVGLRC